MAPKEVKVKEPEAAVQTLADRAGEGGAVGVAHIFASFNDTFVHVTDLSGKETLCRVTGGMKVKADRDESSPLRRHARRAGRRHSRQGAGHHRAAHQAARDGREQDEDPGPRRAVGARALARAGIKIGRIEDVTPIPTDSTRRKGGRRGRRL